MSKVWRSHTSRHVGEGMREIEMALVVIEAERDRSDVLDLDELQFEQFKHDEVYHREIARLNTQDRLKHMALHFAKYAGNLAESRDGEMLRKTVTDTLIIAVSTANTLNLRLSDVVGTPERLVAHGRTFAEILAINAGRMAAACEKLDHLEDFAFRPVIRESIVTLVQAAVEEAERKGWTITQMVCDRLAGVKQKMIFHGRL